MKKLFLVIASVLFLFLSAHVEQTLFAAAEKKPSYTLYDFYAEWCGPCQEMMPHIKAFEEKHKNNVQVIEVDIDNKKNKKLTEKYTVSSIPRLILINKKSDVLSDITGYRGEKELDEMLSFAIPLETDFKNLSDEELFAKAKQLLADEKYDASFPYLMHFIHKNPKNAVYLREFGHLYFSGKDYRLAAKTYESIESTQEYKQDTQSQLEFASSIMESMWEEKDRDKAKSVLSDIEKQKPDFPGLHYAKGITLLWRADSEAEKEFLKELEKNPGHEQAAEDLLNLYKRHRRWDEAIEVKKLLNKMHIKQKTLDWNDFYDSQGLGWLYFQKGDFQKGMREYKKAATGDLTSVGYYYYGEVLELAREEEKAKEAYEKVLAGFAGDYTKNLSRKALNRIKRWAGKRKKVIFPGIQVEALTKEKIQEYDLPEKTWGLLIQRIFRGTQAENTGLQAGDVIKVINGKEMRTYEDYQSLLEEVKLTDYLILEVQRQDDVKVVAFRNVQVSDYPYLKLFMPGTPSKIKAKRTKTENMRHGKITFMNAAKMQKRIPEIKTAVDDSIETVFDFIKENINKNFDLTIFDSISQLCKTYGDCTEGFVSVGAHAITTADSPYLSESLTRLIAYDASTTLGQRNFDFLFYGFGSFMAGTFQGRDIDLLTKVAFEKNKIFSVQDLLILNDFLHYERGVSLPVAGSFVKYLIENYDWDSFKELWKNARGDNYEEAFKKSFGEPLEGVEKKWLEKIGVKTTTASAPCGEGVTCNQGF